jgi:peroxiredoxin
MAPARRQWLIAGGFALGLVVLVGIGLTRVPPAAGVGGAAPDFRATHLGTGESVSLASYRGQVVLLNVWATWCPPCEAEMPEFQRLYQELGPDGLRILAVSVDETGGEVVRQWARERGLTFDILHDPRREIEHTYQTIGLPETFIIDRAGRVVKRVTGHVLSWDAPQQKAFLRRLLSQHAPGAD